MTKQLLFSFYRQHDFSSWECQCISSKEKKNESLDSSSLGPVLSVAEIGSMATSLEREIHSPSRQQVCDGAA